MNIIVLEAEPHCSSYYPYSELSSATGSWEKRRASEEEFLAIPRRELREANKLNSNPICRDLIFPFFRLEIK
jgi:hypothetical protein